MGTTNKFGLSLKWTKHLALSGNENISRFEDSGAIAELPSHVRRRDSDTLVQPFRRSTFLALPCRQSGQFDLALPVAVWPNLMALPGGSLANFRGRRAEVCPLTPPTCHLFSRGCEAGRRQLDHKFVGTHKRGLANLKRHPQMRSGQCEAPAHAVWPI